jgi:RNA polymerase sigma-70 factor (ECF subfamily)
MNNLRDVLRKLKSRRAVSERSLDAALDHSSVRVNAWLAGPDSTPSAKAVRREECEKVTAALACLPERQREAIVLQRWHGWKLAQIAEHLGCSPGAAAVLIHRGQRRLRELLEQTGNEP